MDTYNEMVKRFSTDVLKELLTNFRKYGTSEGARAAWDTRGRGQRAKPTSAPASDSHQSPEWWEKVESDKGNLDKYRAQLQETKRGYEEYGKNTGDKKGVKNALAAVNRDIARLDAMKDKNVKPTQEQLSPKEQATVTRETKQLLRGKDKQMIRRYVASTKEKLDNFSAEDMKAPEGLRTYHMLGLQWDAARELLEG